MFYFLFKSHAAVALGSLYAMERWNTEINSKHRLADDATLVDTIERLTAFCENIANGSQQAAAARLPERAAAADGPDSGTGI
uniref:Uncharacterized protein n=1 Tax=Tanacetum cinerariifolium TaxID=118510 RepID=A0A699S6G3_TANCI|nr:hypothetical protein [Tanacetum cinerariifolium]